MRIINKRAVKTKVKVNPYPHTCSVCGNPARRIKQIVLCSNLKCKTRKTATKVISAFNNSKAPKLYVDSENYILCQCGERARFTAGNTIDKVSCGRASHYCVVPLIKGWRLFRHGGIGFIFNGKRWIEDKGGKIEF
jgi:hypothetical protein